jgi:predicted TIM-barrel fold metal-dependent hydrolase
VNGYPTKFESLHDLAKLPWFEMKEGRLVLADRSAGPAIDVHTHLALAYGTGRVALGEAPRETEHYLPADRALDLDIYINKNFTPEDLKRLEHDLTLLSLTARGMRATHTLPNLRREMGELNITKSVLLPIDFPVLSHNAERWLEVSRGAGEIVCFGSVHPYARRMEARLDALVAMGARGVKVHPAVQLVAPDNKRAMRLYKMCGERGLPILFHCGPVGIEMALGRKLTQVRRYEQPLAENPSTTFVLGHSGALQMDEAIELVKKYPNAYVECSSQAVSNVKRLVDELPTERILFGSDWPFYHQAIGLAKVFMAVPNDKQRRAILHDNARQLFGLAA